MFHLGKGVGDVDPLGQLFAPPTELLFAGTFEEAKLMALGENKLLLVNIQDPLTFGSHQLNRDVWRSESTARNVGDADGALFRDLYGFKSSPAVALVDPRTGRSCHRWPAERLTDLLHFESELCEAVELAAEREKVRNQSLPAINAELAELHKLRDSRRRP